MFDVRVIWNKKYSPGPGNRVENIRFENIEYNGTLDNPSRIHGYDGERLVENVSFVNLKINGKLVTETEKSKFDINEYANNITFLEK